MSWLKKLLGGPAKAPAKSTAQKKGMPAVADSPRAKAIAEAKRIHRTQSAMVRTQIANSIDELQRAGPKILRDPAQLERLMGLIQAQRAVGGLMRHDLKRYMVLTGLRQWLGKDKVSPPARPRVVKR
jgi:hypothetical protein